VATYAAKQWKRLLNFLGTLGTVENVAPGRITLELHETGKTLEIVMTPDEWVAMVSIPWGNFRDAAEDVKRSMLSAKKNMRFLIYADYRLEPSPTSVLPPDPILERLDELLRQNNGKPIGSWVTHDDEGSVASRLSDFPDDPRARRVSTA
jgi:hypothetical protein